MANPPASSSRQILPWALFLGMSWTWCIGMFLPVLLVRDLGWWGWVVFAVPNVLGAAGMGFMLRTRSQSLRMVAQHRPAMRLFSWVTIAFHIFFIQWLVSWRLDWLWAVAGLMGVAVALTWISLRFQGGIGITATVVFLVSLGVMVFALVYGRQFSLPAISPAVGFRAWLGSLELLPVCLLGFIFCPYLDLTFHSARQHLLRGPAKAAFGIGFGLFFLAMILFALHCAPTLACAIAENPSQIPTAWSGMLAIYLVVQSALTVVYHLQGLWRTQKRRPWGNWPVIVAVLAPMTLAEICGSPWRVFGLDCGEVVYRCFMGFYGLVFPAYAWICMRPLASPRTPTIGRIALAAAAIVVAMPFFFLGFIMNHMVWLVPGVAIVLAAGLMPFAPRPPGRRRDLSEFAGTWVEDPQTDAALKDQDRIDPELWK